MMEAVLLIVILIAVFLLTQWGTMWMGKRACVAIIEDLSDKGAHTPDSAVALPYAQKRGMFHVGARDYKPHALQYLMGKEIVHTTDDGRFYLDAVKARDVKL